MSEKKLSPNGILIGMQTRFSPSFIGIGATHAGLPQVTKWLSEHPDVADTIPAANFFNTKTYEKQGIRWYEEKLLATIKKPEQKAGDCTAGYLFTSGVSEKIAHHFAEAKLFVIVRHPLLRALAEYEAHKSIDSTAATMTAAEYLARNEMVQQYSCYADYLTEFFDYHSPIDMHILVYEELAASPLETIQKLYDYIGVNRQVIPRGLKQFAPPPEPPKNPGLIKRTTMKVKALYKKLVERPVGPVFPPDPVLETLLTPEEKAMFLEVFIPATERLSHMMGRDMVTFWNLDSQNNEQ